MAALHHARREPANPGEHAVELAAILDECPIPLFIQKDGLIAYSNRAAARDFGDGVEVGRGSFIAAENLHPDDRAAFDAAFTRPGVQFARVIVRFQLTPGKFRQTLISMFSVDFGGEAIAYVVRDLSIDLAEQAQLLVAGRATSAATLAAGVAHEINNPLATVRANIGFVLEQLQSLAEILTPAAAEVVVRLRQSLEALNDMDASATRIEQIVRDLRAFAPSDGDDRTTVDVNEVLKVAVRRTQSDLEERAKLVCDFGDAMLIEASPGRLAQTFSHVLTNAAEAITKGSADQNEIRITTRLEGAAAQIEISDSGHGILPDVHARMFDPFFTTKPPGSGVGLGLFVVHSVVSALGGSIEVRPRGSEPGESMSTEIRKGTTVRIVLPVLHDPPRSQKQAR